MDGAALESAWNEHHRYLFNWLSRRTGSVEEAEDLMGETWLRACQAWDQYVDDGRLRAWLYRIALNVYLDERRRRQVIRFQSLDANLARSGTMIGGDGRLHAVVLHVASRANVESLAIVRESLAEYQVALAALTPPQRAVTILRLRGWGYGDIATMLGTTRGSVKSLLHRSRAVLRRTLPPNWQAAA